MFVNTRDVHTWHNAQCIFTKTMAASALFIASIKKALPIYKHSMYIHYREKQTYNDSPRCSYNMSSGTI